MKAIDLDFSPGSNSFEEDHLWSSGANEHDTGGSGIIYPPPIDPLDGLEVVCGGGSFTRGILRVVPYRRLKKGQQLFETELWAPHENESAGGVFGTIPQEAVDVGAMYEQEIIVDDRSDMDELQQFDEAIEAAAEEEAEAKRKAEKLKMLKARAEAAIEARKQKKSENNKVKDQEEDQDALAMEKKRKEEKMELLRKQAEAAMSRRRKNR